MHSSGCHPHPHQLPDDTMANQCLFLQVPAQKLYFHAEGSAMESVQADMLWVSKQALDAGTYDALLGE